MAITTLTSLAGTALLFASARAQQLPTWTAPRGDPSKPLGGWSWAEGTSFANIYNATAAVGTYNHASMIAYGAENGDASMFLVAFKNGVTDEDAPGQRVLYSQSYDGLNWTATDGTNILFPNMSTAANPAALFAEPPIWLNGRLYAAASPKQFCLYPDPYQDVLLLRRVYTNETGRFGPIFWASSPPPPAFAQASALNGVVDVTQMDAQTQADVSLLTPKATYLPCYVPGNATGKCEACYGGCQPWSAAAGKTVNERTHYTLPGQGPDSYNDVLLYRSSGSQNILYASVRSSPGIDGWGPVTATDMPNDQSNINAGALPDGRRYLLMNPMPWTMRDPLAVVTSKDGLTWDSVRVIMSCTALPGDQCGARFPGTYKNPGPSYPQGVVVPGLGALYVVATNNKENVWVARVPLDSF